MSDKALITLNPAKPDFSLTAAALVWGGTLALEDAAAMTGLTEDAVIDLIENRLPEIRIEHIRLVASGQLQELIGRHDLFDIMKRLRDAIPEMSPGQLLSTGAFMHQVSGLHHDRQLSAKSEEVKFAVRILTGNDPTPEGGRGIVLDLRPKIKAVDDT
jgi:hypothetical protein